MAELEDRHGNELRVKLDEGRHAYTVSIAGSGEEAGRAFYTDTKAGDERIFYHTEVDEEFGGRGIASVLVEESLRLVARDGLTVVPVCPLYVKYLEKNGAEYKLAGGQFRDAAKDDYRAAKEAS